MGCGASKSFDLKTSQEPTQKQQQQEHSDFEEKKVAWKKSEHLKSVEAINSGADRKSKDIAPPADRRKMAGISEEILHSFEHLSNRRTKIVGTLGPASIPKIPELISAGINVFRLNFSHVTDPETQTPVVKAIRDASKDLGLPVAILGDLGGPKIRCGTFSTPSGTITLTRGNDVRMLHSKEPGTEGIITTPISQIVGALELGHRVLLDDGSISLRVKKRVSSEEIILEVIVGGVLKSHKGINVPDMAVALPALTEKDKSDAIFMYRHRLDYVALSFVQKPEDVQDLLDLFESLKQKEGDEGVPEGITDDLEIEEDWRPRIISKIEKPQALEVIDDIIRITDGIMVARGDLGVECSLEQVPIIQKTLIRKANAAEKPVITATQMLESMINSPVPTRAEVSDVSNAIFDGTDAVMLSAECATGQYPVETVQMMASICRHAESGDNFMHPKGFNAAEMQAYRSLYLGNKKVSEFAHSIADAATAAAIEASAKALIVFTTSGEMPTFISKRRPPMPIIAVTPTASIYRRLSLLFGVQPVLSGGLKVPLVSGKVSQLKGGEQEAIEPDQSRSSETTKGPPVTVVRNTDAILAITEKDLLDSPSVRLTSLKEGDVVVFCAGFHHPFSGLSNTIKMAKFGDSIRSQAAADKWRQSLTMLHDLSIGKA